MKVRDSGMPEQAFWETLFDVAGILDRLGVDARIGDAIEVGCGYGTFTVPVAARIGGTLHAYDIEPAMVELTRRRMEAAGVRNVRAMQRDVVADGFDRPAASVDAVLLFNILHAEHPQEMMRTAAAALRPGGRIFAIHWRSDIATPRGPERAIRPTAEHIAAWGAAARLRAHAAQVLPPWHFGVVLQRDGAP